MIGYGVLAVAGGSGSFYPGLWSDILDPLVGHWWKPGEHVAQKKCAANLVPKAVTAFEQG